MISIDYEIEVKAIAPTAKIEKIGDYKGIDIYGIFVNNVLVISGANVDGHLWECAHFSITKRPMNYE
jgi:hypothetical protein